MVEGFTRTEGVGMGRLSSIPGRVWGRRTNRMMGGGLITMGRGEAVGGKVMDTQREMGRYTGDNGGGWAHWNAGCWRSQVGWGWHREYGQLTCMAWVNSEGRDLMN